MKDERGAFAAPAQNAVTDRTNGSDSKLLPSETGRGHPSTFHVHPCRLRFRAARTAARPSAAGVAKKAFSIAFFAFGDCMPASKVSYSAVRSLRSCERAFTSAWNS